MQKIETLKTRDRIFQNIRCYFHQLGFIEVHTPLLVKNPGLEPHLRYFQTEFIPEMGGGKKETYYLPTSPEYHLKKALALGLDKIFEITKSFRNGEKSARHEPEFFMLEWYRSPGQLQDIQDDFGQILSGLGQQFSPGKPWQQSQSLSVHEAFVKFAEIDLEGALNGKNKGLFEQGRDLGIVSLFPDDDFETLFHKIMIEKIEPFLGFEGPLFLHSYPASMCALAKISSSNPLFCERFEVYWEGIELANAFGELTDPVEQKKRCEADIAYRMQHFGSSPPMDDEFIQALGKIQSPAAGIAVGLDRLVACLLGVRDIRDVIAFPHW